jgi:hypothetical protein
MSIKITVSNFFHVIVRRIPFASRQQTIPAAPPEQLTLDLDQITEGGLRLREALPVRSAEYWLQLGQPDRALEELQTLPASTRQQPWPLRVQLNAFHANRNLQLTHAV